VKRSSRTGYFGVTPNRGKFRAAYESKGRVVRVIGIFDSPEEAARASDEHLRERCRQEPRRWLRHYQHLNFAGPEDFRAYEEAMAAYNARAVAEAVWRADALNAPVPQDQLLEVLALHRQGFSTAELATRFGVSVEQIDLAIVKAERQRREALNAEVEEEPITPSETILARIRERFRVGT
jgi:DNA-directed RNA polymerase specialized sigma24 family protein